MSEPALALSGEDEWVAEGASIITQDGSVDSITFGDPDETSDPGSTDNRLVLEWSGFNNSSSTAAFDVSLRGSENDEDGIGWDGDQLNYESIIVPEADDPAEVSLSGNSGDLTLSWNDAFGIYQPADVSVHPHIDLVDFEADDGQERNRVVDVQIEVTVPEESLTATAEAEATISVTNKGAEISVGGQGTFLIESDSEV